MTASGGGGGGSGSRQLRVALDYNRLGIMVLLAILIYNEFIVYWRSYSAWPDMTTTIQESTSLNVLFVADPQIQGAHDSSWPFVGTISRWDSDRYLSKTYSWALSAYDPKVIIFLGDLIDEGSECDDDEFEGYVSRFRGIYGIKNSKKQQRVHIFVAGDNDIGGEGVDPVTEDKVVRFYKNFPQKPIYVFDDNFKEINRLDMKEDEFAKTPLVEIVPVNMLTHKSPETDWQDIEERTMNVKFRIIVSHLPVLPTPHSQFSHDLMKKLKPSVIFSAHDHRGLDYVAKRSPNAKENSNITFFTQYSTGIDSEEDSNRILVFQKDTLTEAKEGAPAPLEVDINELIHEVIVPTCSYRMGVKEMALGLAAIDLTEGNEKIAYTNLWLPGRFPLLYAYMAAIMMAVTFFALGRIRGTRRRRSSSTSSSFARRRSLSSSPRSRNAIRYSKLV